MSRSTRLLVITFIESVATVLVERGVMFLTHARLGFSDSANLCLALVFGVTYAAGSLASHVLARRVGERRLVLICLAVQVAVCLAMGAWLNVATVFVGSALLAGLAGLKWAVVESYVSAGLEPSQTARAIGRFNVAWSLAVPLALLPTGAIIVWWHPGLFHISALLSVASLVLFRALPARPTHRELSPGGAEGAAAARRTAGLLAFSRWQMLGGYSLMWILAALMPGVFGRLGLDVTEATVAAAVLDLMRMVSFVLLARTARWHDRFGPLVLASVLLPAGFLLFVFAPHLAAALAGEALFGVAAGMLYYAALYYAMVITNASVAGGGAHEGLIGLSFIFGPAAGLAGQALAPALGGSLALGTLVGITPLLAVPAVGAAWAYRRACARPRPHLAEAPDHDVPTLPRL